MTNDRQRFSRLFNKEGKKAIADILEKIGTALLIGVVLGSIISTKEIDSTWGLYLIVFVSLFSLIYSVYLRTEEEETCHSADQ